MIFSIGGVVVALRGGVTIFELDEFG